MQIEDQVCSLELAKKLKELGIEQKSLVLWSEYPHIMKFNEETKKHDCIETMIEIKGTSYWRQDEIESWSAFTAQELLELLPSKIMLKENEPFNSFRLRIEKCLLCSDNTIESLSPHYIINYRCDSTECTGENAWFERTLLPNNIYDKKLADCAAKMIIYLIENGLMEIQR